MKKNQLIKQYESKIEKLTHQLETCEASNQKLQQQLDEQEIIIHTKYDEVVCLCPNQHHYQSSINSNDTPTTLRLSSKHGGVLSQQLTLEQQESLQQTQYNTVLASRTPFCESEEDDDDNENKYSNNNSNNNNYDNENHDRNDDKNEKQNENNNNNVGLITNGQPKTGH